MQNEIHERRRLTLEQLLDVESMLDEPSPIIEIYNRWNAGVISDRCGICGIIDMTPEDPFQYRIERHMHISVQGLDGLRMIEHPLRLHAKMCAMEYLEVKETQQPTGFYVNQFVGGWEREYVRLILPDGNRAKYIVRYLKPPRFVAQVHLEAVS